MQNRIICLLVWVVVVACEPYDLTKKNFPVCAKPSASIGYTADGLDVTFFLENPQGDIGIVGWDPGDNKGKTLVKPRAIYSYEKAGIYTVTLLIGNLCDDKFSATRQITVSN